MNTKLTLTVEKSIIERAKLYAKNTGRSLSEIIETYLSGLTSEVDQPKLSSSLKKIVGSVKLPENFDEKKELQNYFEKKHL